MLGLIVWGILILIIACAACPGFMEFLAVVLVGAILFFLGFWLLVRISKAIKR